ncbi:MAG: hypothetical protein IKH16_05985 [Selenomonadaceae bacterium]|nr:hypothetical protein [Selenomonadaceae bacterium]
MTDPRPLYMNDPDPWGACHWGLVDHPHYLDCTNCYYGKHCDIGAIELERMELEAQRKECEKIVSDAMNWDPEYEDCIAAARAAEKYLERTRRESPF